MSKNIRDQRTFTQATMTDAFAVAQRLEAIERQRQPNIGAARRRLADKLRIGLGSLENIIRGRVKRIDHAVKRRLDELLIRELQSEILRLKHDLALARQSGAHPASEHLSEIETHLARARALIGGSYGEDEGEC